MGARGRGAGPAARAAVALRLRAPMEAELRARGLWDLFAETEMPLIEVLASMEVRGVCVEASALRALGEVDRAQWAGLLRPRLVALGAGADDR